MHSNLVVRYTSECCLSFYDRISIIFSPLDFCRHFLSLMTYPPNEFLSSFWKKVSSGISVSLYHSASQLLTMGKMPKKVFLDENQSLPNSSLQAHHNKDILFSLLQVQSRFSAIKICEKLSQQKKLPTSSSMRCFLTKVSKLLIFAQCALVATGDFSKSLPYFQAPYAQEKRAFQEAPAPLTRYFMCRRDCLLERGSRASSSKKGTVFQQKDIRRTLSRNFR